MHWWFQEHLGNEIKIKAILTKNQKADLFVKPLRTTVFEKICKLLLGWQFFCLIVAFSLACSDDDALHKGMPMKGLTCLPCVVVQKFTSPRHAERVPTWLALPPLGDESDLSPCGEETV